MPTEGSTCRGSSSSSCTRHRATCRAKRPKRSATAAAPGQPRSKLSIVAERRAHVSLCRASIRSVAPPGQSTRAAAGCARNRASTTSSRFSTPLATSSPIPSSSTPSARCSGSNPSLSTVAAPRCHVCRSASTTAWDCVCRPEQSLAVNC